MKVHVERGLNFFVVVIFGPDPPSLLLLSQIATIQTPLSLSSLCVGGRGMLSTAGRRGGME
jgi:hypothetical protein